MIAAEKERLQQRSPPDIQRADALRAMHLVARQGQQGAADFPDVQRHLAGGLHRIGVERNAGLLRNLRDLGDRLQDARLIVREHDGDEPRLRRNSCANVFRQNATGRVRLQPGNARTALFQAQRGIHDGVVLDGAGDDVDLSHWHAVGNMAAKDSEDGEIIALRSSTGEDDLGRPAIQEAGNGFTGAFDRGAGLLPVAMHAAGVAELLFHGGAHGFPHLRQQRRGGVGVHVNAVHGCLHCRFLLVFMRPEG